MISEILKEEGCGWFYKNSNSRRCSASQVVSLRGLGNRHQKRKPSLVKQVRCECRNILPLSSDDHIEYPSRKHQKVDVM
jgi:hypothetical protein